MSVCLRAQVFWQTDETNWCAACSLLFIRVHGSARLTFRSGRTPRRCPAWLQSGPGWASLGERRESTGMQVRSWMAVAVLVAGSTVLLSGMARSQKSGSDPTPPGAQGQIAGTPKAQDGQNPSVPEKKPVANPQTVELTLIIAGLGQEGCQVEVKAGNQACRFQPQRLRVESQGKAKFVFRDVELRGADRNCTFAITILEAGQASGRSIGLPDRQQTRTRSRDPGRSVVHLLHELPVQAGGSATNRPDAAIASIFAEARFAFFALIFLGGQAGFSTVFFSIRDSTAMARSREPARLLQQPDLENHWVPMRNWALPAVMTFVAQATHPAGALLRDG